MPRLVNLMLLSSVKMETENKKIVVATADFEKAINRYILYRSCRNTA